MDQADTRFSNRTSIYHLSPESKTKKLRKMVRAKQHRRENDIKSEIYTLSADARR